MRGRPGVELALAAAEMAPGEVAEAVPDPPERVQHVHRALHDIGQVPPADAADHLGRRSPDRIPLGEEGEAGRAADHLQRRLQQACDGLDQRRLAGAGFAGEPVDLVAADVEIDAVHRPHLAIDTEIAGAEMRLQIAHLEHRRMVRRLAHRPPPIRARRLRGSMYSFIDTASRKSPTKVITTSAIGKAIHHQMPATSAVCWFAQ